jgi:hypothetical protein
MTEITMSGLLLLTAFLFQMFEEVLDVGPVVERTYMANGKVGVNKDFDAVVAKLLADNEVLRQKLAALPDADLKHI